MIKKLVAFLSLDMFALSAPPVCENRYGQANPTLLTILVILLVDEGPCNKTPAVVDSNVYVW